MNPPGVPAVSSAANETRISWSPGSLQSGLIQTFDFQVEIKLKKQTRAVSAYMNVHAWTFYENIKLLCNVLQEHNVKLQVQSHVQQVCVLVCV